MKNLIFAFKAFIIIITNQPHVYCDHFDHSIIGSDEDVTLQIKVLNAAMDQGRQQSLVNEANEIIHTGRL